MALWSFNVVGGGFVETEVSPLSLRILSFFALSSSSSAGDLSPLLFNIVEIASTHILWSASFGATKNNPAPLAESNNANPFCCM